MNKVKPGALPTVKMEITTEPITPAQRQAWAKIWAWLLTERVVCVSSGKEQHETGE